MTHLPTLQQAIALHQQGQWDQAKQLYLAALEEDPTQVEALQFLAVIARQQGQLELALDYFDRAIALNDQNPVVHFLRGNLLRTLEKEHEAIESYRKTVALQPDHLPALQNCGKALRAIKEPEQALLCFEKILAVRGDHPGVLLDHGETLLELKRPQDALKSFESAIAYMPDYVQAWCSKGNTLRQLKQYAKAIECYDHALSLDPQHLDSTLLRGMVLQELGMPELAEAAFARGCAIKPDSIEGNFNRGMCLLQTGRLQEGWPLYEWRWKTDSLKNSERQFPQPMWRGQPLEGKTIFVHAEQGLGDTLQLCRYTKLLAERGAKVILGIHEGLPPVLKGLAGVHLLFSEGYLPDFDYHCPLLSVPMGFNTSLETIPGDVPYLFADPQQVQIWQERLGSRTKPRIGLVWSGRPDHTNDHNRSLAFSTLSKLLSSKAEFFCLQQTIRASDQEAFQASNRVTHIGREFDNFAQTAAVVEQLDLVISVDTSVAHLVGAMGKPLWLLLPFVADWRWLTKRSDSPWYPSARLFRQPQIDDWAGAIANVARELDAFISSRS